MFTKHRIHTGKVMRLEVVVGLNFTQQPNLKLWWRLLNQYKRMVSLLFLKRSTLIHNTKLICNVFVNTISPRVQRHKFKKVNLTEINQ
jgi:hypothetical protein